MPRPFDDRYDEIYRSLDGVAALAAAEKTTLGVQSGERHTEFIKRIVATYMNEARRIKMETMSAAIGG